MALESKEPSKYIVRFYMDSAYREIECFAWAFSAEDAKYQVELNYGKSSGFRGVTYVGPVNPSCKCGNKCFCGASPPRE